MKRKEVESKLLVLDQYVHLGFRDCNGTKKIF